MPINELFNLDKVYLPINEFFNLDDVYLPIKNSISYYSIMAIITIFLLKVMEKKKLSDIGFTTKNLKKEIKIGLLLSLIPIIIHIIEYSTGGMGIFITWKELLYKGVWILFFVAFVEEFMFRGFLYENLIFIFKSKTIAAVFSSLIFGLVHYEQGGISKVFIVTVIGVLYCVLKIKLKKGGMLALITLHWVQDYSYYIMGFMIGRGYINL